MKLSTMSRLDPETNKLSENVKHLHASCWIFPMHEEDLVSAPEKVHRPSGRGQGEENQLYRFRLIP